jgi:N-acyl-L-homoserine lactone synthetase
MRAAHSTYSYRALIFEGWQLPRQVADQQAFRKRLFVDELGWHLTLDDGLEVDEFDKDAAIYCSLYLGDEIVASWRAIRTSEDYLGRQIFPQLATLRPYPSHHDIWEISRLGAIRHPQRPLSAQCIYALMFHFAASRGALSLCGVVSPLHSRNFERAGIKTRRYGAPQVVGHDAKGRPMSVFFGEIRMSDQSGLALDKMLNPMNEMELQDDALVLGRRAISA